MRRSENRHALVRGSRVLPPQLSVRRSRRLIHRSRTVQSRQAAALSRFQYLGGRRLSSGVSPRQLRKLGRLPQREPVAQQPHIPEGCLLSSPQRAAFPQKSGAGAAWLVGAQDQRGAKWHRNANWIDCTAATIPSLSRDGRLAGPEVASSGSGVFYVAKSRLACQICRICIGNAQFGANPHFSRFMNPDCRQRHPATFGFSRVVEIRTRGSGSQPLLQLPRLNDVLKLCENLRVVAGQEPHDTRIVE